MRNTVLIILTLLFCWQVLKVVQENSPERTRLGFPTENQGRSSPHEWPDVNAVVAGLDNFFKYGPPEIDLFGTRQARGKVRDRASSSQESWGGSVVLPRINKTLYLAAAPDVDRAVVGQIIQSVREEYSINVKLVDTPYVIPADLMARQPDADRLIDRAWPVYKGILEQPTTFGLLIVIGRDMKSQGLNYIFGTADIPMRLGIISIARFAMDDPPRERLMARAVKQAFSTVGFIAGIGRCPTLNCARAYPNNLGEHDRKSARVCNICRRRLARAYQAMEQGRASAVPQGAGQSAASR